MGTWADVSNYNDMIDALQTFCKEIGVGCGVMKNGVATCLQFMQEDKASLKASIRVTN